MAKEINFQGFQSPNYTPVPDELFDLLLAHLSGAELKVLLYIARRTFGFKKSSDDISFNQICSGIKTKDGRVLDEGTGLSKSTAQVAIRGLLEKNVIMAVRRQSPERGNEPTTYALNLKNHSAGEPYTESRHRGGVKIGIGLCRKSAQQETVLQETDYVNVNVGETLLNDKEAEEEALIDELVAQLGDRNHQSRKTYRQILRTLGPSIVWRLLGNTKEASRDGLIETTRAKYFMGMAKKVAQGQGVELGFRAPGSRG